MIESPNTSKLNPAFKTHLYDVLMEGYLGFTYASRVIEYGLRVIESQKILLGYLPKNTVKGLTKSIKSWTSTWIIIHAFDQVRSYFRGEISYPELKEAQFLIGWINYNYQGNEGKNLTQLISKIKRVNLYHHRRKITLEEMKTQFWAKYYKSLYKKAHFMVRTKLRFLLKYGGSNAESDQDQYTQLALDLLEFSFLSLNRSLVSSNLKSKNHLFNIVKNDLDKKINTMIKWHKREKRNAVQRIGTKDGRNVFIHTISHSLDDFAKGKGSSNEGAQDVTTWGELTAKRGVESTLDQMIAQELAYLYSPSRHDMTEGITGISVFNSEEGHSQMLQVISERESIGEPN